MLPLSPSENEREQLDSGRLPLCSGIPRTFLEHSSHTWEKKRVPEKKNTSPKLSIFLS